MFTNAAVKNAQQRQQKQRFDWLKYLIIAYVIVTGVWMFAAPFNPLAVLAFFVGAVAMSAHHKTASWLNQRLQFWGYLIAGLFSGLSMTAGVWFVSAVAWIFIFKRG